MAVERGKSLKVAGLGGSVPTGLYGETPGGGLDSHGSKEGDVSW